MIIQLFKDNTISIDLDNFCEVLNDHCTFFKFIARNEQVHFKSAKLNNPESYEEFSKEIVEAIKQGNENYFATSIAYDNNFFYDGFDNQLIVSFSDWNHYTELPISNGLAYFLTATLASDFSIGRSHKTNTGCLNDFWWDKTGVDVGMKSSFICNKCLESTNLSNDETSKAYHDILSLLDLVSTNSRRNQNILSYQIHKQIESKFEFEIFLCHNSIDKPHVRLINEELKKLGSKTWIDEEQIGLGASWQIELEKQIVSIKNAGVFVGDNGLGPWQSMEIRAFLIEILNNGGRVIPIILPNSKEIPDLPIFLKQFNYLDLRKDYMEGIEKLAETVKSSS